MLRKVRGNSWLARELLHGDLMSTGLLSAKTTVRIQLDAEREIVSACDEVFRPEHQEEARTMIFESEMLSDYMQELGGLLREGPARFVTVTESERQTSFRFDKTGSRAIVLTRAHHGIGKLYGEPS